MSIRGLSFDDIFTDEFRDLGQWRAQDRACAMAVLTSHTQPADRMPTPEQAARMYGRGSPLHLAVVGAHKREAKAC